MTEQLHFHFSLSCIGGGNGNPRQGSCLENPRDRGAWWAAVCGVAQSDTTEATCSSSSSNALWLLGLGHKKDTASTWLTLFCNAHPQNPVTILGGSSDHRKRAYRDVSADNLRMFQLTRSVARHVNEEAFRWFQSPGFKPAHLKPSRTKTITSAQTADSWAK